MLEWVKQMICRNMHIPSTLVNLVIPEVLLVPESRVHHHCPLKVVIFSTRNILNVLHVETKHSVSFGILVSLFLLFYFTYIGC